MEKIQLDIGNDNRKLVAPTGDEVHTHYMYIDMN